MNPKFTKNNLDEFKEYTQEINSSKENATEFYKQLGVNTPTGRLTKVYHHDSRPPIGFKK